MTEALRTSRAPRRGRVLVRQRSISAGAAVGTSNISATQNGVTSNTIALTVTAAALQSIAISAPKTSIAKGTSVQFTATGTFSDGSTQNLTNTATWASSSQSSINISTAGLATGAAIGSSNITATQNGIGSNLFALTVTAATLQSIAISAGSSSIAKGTSVQFTATGTFSDGSSQNLTNSATWTSSSPTAVNISTSGLATGVATGSSNITAVQSGITSNIFALAVTAATLQSINVSALQRRQHAKSNEYRYLGFIQSDHRQHQRFRSGYWIRYRFQQHHCDSKRNRFQYFRAYGHGANATIHQRDCAEYIHRYRTYGTVHCHRHFQRWQHPEPEQHCDLGELGSDKRQYQFHWPGHRRCRRFN
ncbi:MAG: hypothetical protein DMG61_04045 [Acidobacteria bacterium]|nr:MAG: hypothetical protein DMG61_04045 [Acidobacteriota bacterium]